MGEESLTDIPLSPPESDHESKGSPHPPADSSSSSPHGDQQNINQTEVDEEEAAAAAMKVKINKNQEESLVIHPPSQLPRPEAPKGLDRSVSSVSAAAASASPVSTIGKFFRDRSTSLSSAITKHISAFSAADEDPPTPSVTEFNLSGLKVIVKLKDDSDEEEPIRGRITFFSRSSCRDSTAVRSFFRDRGLPYVEINVDVFPERENELVDRTGSSSVPVIFFNDKLVGGLVALNSLRNSGEFDRRVREMAGGRCPESAPSLPVYGFDDEGEIKKERGDKMLEVVRVLRHRLPIQDRIVKMMKIVKNCFAGSEMVEALIHHLDCSRTKAVEIGKELARRNFIHHVFRENDFEDANNHFYRFLEHDPAIPKCFNFRGTTNDNEPKPASIVGQRLTKLMAAILEAYASDDRQHLDYARIATSEEFRRYVNLVQELQRVDIFTLSVDETMAFFLNLYNAMVIHAVIRFGKPAAIDRRAFSGDFQYIVGGYPYSLSTIKNGILRSNRREPYTFIKPFNAGDKRLEVALPNLNPLIHFGLCNGARSSPTVRFFSAQGVEMELRYAAREFFLNGGLEVDLNKRRVCLTRIIKWYSADFGQERETLNWILNYLDASKTGLLTHLLNEGGNINIAYQNFDWYLNSS